MHSGQLWIVQLSEAVSNQIHQLVSSWASADRRHIGDQLVRASDSIGANIVEGYARHHPNDKMRFYSIARGSLEESLLWVRRARDRELISKVAASEVSGLLLKLSRGLTRFIQAETLSGKHGSSAGMRTAMIGGKSETPERR